MSRLCEWTDKETLHEVCAQVTHYWTVASHIVTSGQRILATGRIAWGIFHLENLMCTWLLLRPPMGTLVDSMRRNSDIRTMGTGFGGTPNNADVIPSKLTSHRRGSRLHLILECRAVTLPRRETRWNYLGCPKLTKRSQPLVGRSSPYCGDM